MLDSFKTKIYKILHLCRKQSQINNATLNDNILVLLNKHVTFLLYQQLLLNISKSSTLQTYYIIIVGILILISSLS